MAISWKVSGAPSNAPYLDWLNGPGRAYAPGAEQGLGDKLFLHLTSGFELQLSTSAAGSELAFPAPLHQSAYSNPPANVVFNKKTQASADSDVSVIVAIIDDGINVAHQNFTDADGDTRFDFAWMQDGPAKGAVAFGREVTGANINSARAGNSPAGALRALGLDGGLRPGENTLTTRASHGTHVADLATGCAPEKRKTPDLKHQRLIGVSLPFFVSNDTSGALFPPFVAAALDYVMDRAASIAPTGPQKTPLIINFSYSSTAGPHDGTGLLERIISAALNNAPDNIAPEIVLPAGNRYQARGHASFNADQTGQWRVPPGDTTANFVEIWFDNGVTTPALEITPPGAATQTVQPGQSFELMNGTNVLARASLALDAASGRHQALIATGPTAPKSGSSGAPSGNWLITPKGGSALAWIQRDEAPYCRTPGAVQSYWVETAYERFDENSRQPMNDRHSAYTRRNGSLSGMASINDPRVVVVGGYNEATLEFADYSAADTTRPHVAGVSDRSSARCGVRGAATLSGRGVTFSGTSVASPQITRRLAKLRANNIAGKVDVAKLHVEGKPPVRPAPLPKPGKLRIAQDTRPGTRIERQARP